MLPTKLTNPEEDKRFVDEVSKNIHPPLGKSIRITPVRRRGKLDRIVVTVYDRETKPADEGQSAEAL